MRITTFTFDRENIVKLILLFVILACFSMGAAFVLADQFLCWTTFQWIIVAVLVSMTVLGPAFMSTDDQRDDHHLFKNRFN